MPTANSSMPKMNTVKMQGFVGDRIRQIRRHEADPLTKKDLRKFLQKMGIQ